MVWSRFGGQVDNLVQNMDYLEMSKAPFLNDPGSGTFTPGEVYYTTQLLDKFENTGDTFVSTVYNDSKLRVFAGPTHTHEAQNPVKFSV